MVYYLSDQSISEIFIKLINEIIRIVDMDASTVPNLKASVKIESEKLQQSGQSGEANPSGNIM